MEVGEDMPSSIDETAKLAADRAAEFAGLNPSLDDLEVRIQRRATKMRVGAGLVGILISVALITTLLSIGNGATPKPSPSHEVGGGSLVGVAEAIPAGDWLLQLDDAPAISESAVDSTVFLSEPESLVVHDIAPDGSRILATVEQQIRYTGVGDAGSATLSRLSKLLFLDSKAGTPTSIVTASGSEGFVGPILWSPDGSHIAYRLARWTVDVTSSSEHPGQAKQVNVCIWALSTGPGCYEEPGHVTSLDWSPTGEELVLEEEGAQGVSILTLATGQVRRISESGPSSVGDSLKDQGLGSLLSLDHPLWSPSGKYIAALAETTQHTGFVPLVFDLDGQVVAVGKSGAGNIGWSPIADQLAYTTGFVRSTPETPWSIRLLDVISGDRLLASLDNDENPVVYGLIWAPDGRWLAADGSHAEDRDTIKVFDVFDGRELTAVSFATEQVAPLVDWGEG
jgi:Tol biopolymer transport system component